MTLSLLVLKINVILDKNVIQLSCLSCISMLKNTYFNTYYEKLIHKAPCISSALYLPHHTVLVTH